MTLPSYDEITRQLGIPRCRGILPNGQYCPADHAEGEVDIFPSRPPRTYQVHWGDNRRVTRAGIRRYLALAAWRIAMGRFPSEPVWRVHYEALREIPALAREIHIQLPHKLGDLDRAQLKAMMVKVPPSELRAEVMRWLDSQRTRSGGVRRAAP